jgi:hypothetical protein
MNMSRLLFTKPGLLERKEFAPVYREATATLMLGRKHLLMYLPAYPVALTRESIWLAVNITQARVLDELLSERYRHHEAIAELPRKQLPPWQPRRALW